MKRVKLIVAYDGTNYCGWQVQPNGLAVQEVVNRCLSQLLREDISVIGFDNTIISRIVSPPATSVACDYRELAQKLIGTAVDAAEGRSVPERQLVGTTLHERRSCRKID